MGKNRSNGKKKLIVPKWTAKFFITLTVRSIVFLYLGAVVLLPIFMVFYQAMKDGPGALWKAFTNEEALYAFKLTFTTAGVVTLLNMVLGTVAAYALVRLRFPGRRVLDALIDLPFAIPTAVIGLTLASMLGPKSPIGAFLKSQGCDILYQPSSIYIAFMVVTLPFVIRAVEPLLRSIDPSEEEAAVTLGAGPWSVFINVVLPIIRPGILSGAVLTFARSLGEFGVVVFVAGTEPFHTEVAATYIFSRIEQFDFRGGAAASVLVLSVSYLLLWFIKFFEILPENRKRQGG